MTQKRYWDVTVAFSADNIRATQIGLNKAGVYKRYDITVVSANAVQLGANGFALMPDGVAVSEDAPLTLRQAVMSPTAIIYTITARHNEATLQTRGVPVLYAIEPVYHENDSLADGIVLGWIHYPGGGAALTQAMIELAPLVGEGGLPGGNAGGDLYKFYPEPWVGGLRGIPIDASAESVVDGDILVVESGKYMPKNVQDVLGTGIPSADFNILGPSGDYVTPTSFVDGFRKFGVAAQIASITLSQEIAGSAGSTDITVYKIDEMGAITQITPPGSVSLGFSSGDRAQVVSSAFLPGTNSLLSTDRLGIKVDSLQVGGEDASVNIVVAGATLPAPNVFNYSTAITQSMNESMLGDTLSYAGSVYLPQGTILAAESRVAFGAALPGDTAQLQLRRMSDSAVVFDTSVAGETVSVSPVANIAITQSGFYEWWMRSPSDGAAIFRGYHLAWQPTPGRDISYGTTESTLGTVPEVVGYLHLSAGVLQGGMEVVLASFGSTTPSPTTYFEIRHPVTDAIVVSMQTSGAGGREVVVKPSPVTLPVTGFYKLRIFGNGVDVASSFNGIRAVVLS